MIGLAAALLLIPMGTAAALWIAPSADSQAPSEKETGLVSSAVTAACTGFLDEDGDGVCDRCAGTVCASRAVCAGFCDEDGDGVCDRCAGAVCASREPCTPQAAQQSGHHEEHHGSGHHGA